MKIAGSLVLLLGGIAPAQGADAVWDSLIGIGLNKTERGIVWRMPLMDADRLLPSNLKIEAKPNTAITLAVRVGECSFDVSLTSLRVTAARVAAGQEAPIYGDLESIQSMFVEGPGPRCLDAVRQELRRLYGGEVFTVSRLDWVYVRLNGETVRGPTFESSFESHGTCARLRWSEGDGFPSMKPLFTVGLNPRACERDLQPEVPVIFFEPGNPR